MTSISRSLVDALVRNQGKILATVLGPIAFIVSASVILSLTGGWLNGGELSGVMDGMPIAASPTETTWDGASWLRGTATPDPDLEPAAEPGASDRAPQTTGLMLALLASLAFSAVVATKAKEQTPIPSDIGLRMENRARYYREGDVNSDLIVFIHGWNGDATETWLDFPRLFGSDERFDGVDIVLVDYPTFMLRRNPNVAELSNWMRKSLNALLTREYGRIAIVAHSMGGIAARELVIQHRLAQSRLQVGLLVEIAVPHNGANGAALANYLGVSKGFAGSLHAGRNSFLKGQALRWSLLRDRPSTVCFWHPSDPVVPSDSAKSECPDSTAIMFEDDRRTSIHSLLVKPPSHEDDRYRLPAHEIAQFLS